MELKKGLTFARYEDGSWAIWRGANPHQAEARGSKNDVVPERFHAGRIAAVNKRRVARGKKPLTGGHAGDKLGHPFRGNQYK